MHRRRLLAWSLMAAAAALAALPARGQGVDLVSLELQRHEGWLKLEFNARLQLSRAQKQLDDPDEVRRLEQEIAITQARIDKLKAQA